MHIYNHILIKLNGLLGVLPLPDKWVFIVGCYNSGTTLLHELLATHSEIGSMPNEGQVYTDQLLLPKSVGLPRLWALKPERFRLVEGCGRNINVEKLKRQWGARYDFPRRPVLLEKSPTNAARTRWLQEHFENAHFIGVIRNGYAVAEGIHRKAGHSMDIAALQWVRSNEIMLEDFEFLHNKILVRYEELCERPDDTIKTILEFLHLESNGFQVSTESWHIHEKVSPIRNMNGKSLSGLSVSDRKVIYGVAGKLLDELGYTAEPEKSVGSIELKR